MPTRPEHVDQHYNEREPVGQIEHAAHSSVVAPKTVLETYPGHGRCQGHQHVDAKDGQYPGPNGTVSRISHGQNNPCGKHNLYE